MKILFLILIFCLNVKIAKSQSQEFIDSLKMDVKNEILVFQRSCVGCIVMKSPCEGYKDQGNPWDKYVIWKNKKVFHIRKFNNCGVSKTFKFKSWKNNPFELIKTKTIELDTTKIQYPLSFNQKDSTWFETGINHFKYYNFSFPTSKIKDLEIRDYAFREVNEDDKEYWIGFKYKYKEVELNYYRYKNNNETAIKKLLDIVEKKLITAEKKLKIESMK